MSEYYTYDQVADRIAAELGVRPSPSTLRAAASSTGLGRRSGRSRITIGLPAPTPGLRHGKAVFSAAAIEAWLATHPHRALDQAVELLEHADPTGLDVAVARARNAGLSWAQVAAALATATGVTRSKQWAQWRYGSSLPGSNPPASQT